MSIQDFRQKFKQSLGDDEFFTIAVIILVALVSFGLGRHAGSGPGGNEVDGATSRAMIGESAEGEKTELPLGVAEPAGETYVGSKNSDKYHLPWCPGAKRISEANKVWFSSQAEAAAAGYTPAGNCSGI